eukprot:1142436-Pelagomonas_calceolata.AAC.1
MLPQLAAAITLAEAVSGLIYSSYQVALQTCKPQIISLKKLSLIRSIQSLLTSLAINQTDNT